MIDVHLTIDNRIVTPTNQATFDNNRGRLGSFSGMWVSLLSVTSQATKAPTGDAMRALHRRIESIDEEGSE